MTTPAEIIGPDNVELLHFAFAADDAESQLGLSGRRLDLLNIQLTGEQVLWELSFADTLGRYHGEERLALQIMFTSAFRRGFTLGARSGAINQTGEE